MPRSRKSIRSLIPCSDKQNFNHSAAELQPKTESRIAKIAIIENHQQNLYNAEVTKYTEEHRGICEKKQDFKSPRSTKVHEGFSRSFFLIIVAAFPLRI